MARRVAPLSPNDGHYIHDTVQSPDFMGMEEGSPDGFRAQHLDVMSPNRLTMSSNTPVFESASNMGLKNLRTPVVEKHSLVGIDDLNRGLFFEHGIQQ